MKPYAFPLVAIALAGCAVLAAQTTAVPQSAGGTAREAPASPPAGSADPATAAAPPVTGGEAFAAECGTCHLPYLPAFLPARSWEAITSDLAHHFGEDASLDAATTRAITDYLVANAADASRRSRRFLRGIDAGETPLRITGTPWWQSAHREVSARHFASDKVKTPSNCAACHRAAVSGSFDDDD
ncbi:diheme cytochrome c [Propylenella binzhouense]|uniref:Cytochrome C n=1 Tax=Propylenella binzhouense TaxID=2555902 RepID=A0A964T7M3_9HYPH|nr:diheme cytochrome c [Propylenella binzhouense]MYZ49382.1 cytochrome C [Propylenella binzhouense]